MRALLISILIVLTGCTSLSPEERAQRQEDRQYEWQETCIAFRQATKDCMKAGGVMYTRTWGRVTSRTGDCPRHVLDMTMAVCGSPPSLR